MIPYCEFNVTDYPADMDVNLHECMFFVCETLYINVHIQTGNKNTENWKWREVNCPGFDDDKGINKEHRLN